MTGILAQASGATRRFGSFTAVSAVNLTIGPGEVVGLLGANGAGKTTLIRMLLGLLRPSGGTIRLFGGPPSRAARRRVGYVPQTLGLYAGLTVAENWAFTAAAFGEGGLELPDGLAEWRDDLVGGLPLGPQRRVAFATALSHRPELLVLDEPTSGVGPLGSARLWEEIRRSCDQGAGVLVTTHNMEEAQQCDRLVVMVAGSVVATGTADDIIADAGIPAATGTGPANLEEAFVAIVGRSAPVGRSADSGPTAGGSADGGPTAGGSAGTAGRKPAE